LSLLLSVGFQRPAVSKWRWEAPAPSEETSEKKYVTSDQNSMIS
jgi:hypothetical protein